MGEDTLFIVVEEILRESDKAVQVLYEGKEQWIPRSQLFGYDLYVGEKNVELEVSEWFLNKEGLI